MAKIKSTLTGGSTVNHKKAYDRIYHREDCVGTTRDGIHVYAQVNSHPLDSMVESASVRTTSGYDWKTGEFKKKKLDIVQNAKNNINYLSVHPVTNARQCKNDYNLNGSATCSSPTGPDRWGRK
jgi:hypothetical protein